MSPFFHLLFDFYFQSNKMAAEKEESGIDLSLHCLIYAADTATTVLLLFEVSAAAIVASFIVLALSHWIIDGRPRGAIAGRGLSPIGSFLVDQVLHVVILLMLSATCCHLWAMRPIALNLLDTHGVELFWISTLCFCGRPCSIVIAKALQSLRSVDVEQSEEASIVYSGKWIGIFERLIVATLSLLNQYSVIAFIFTAKGIARFKRLESDKDFAEIYLLASLASVFLAMASAILFMHLLNFVGC
jgi:hypothetical protein